MRRSLSLLELDSAGDGARARAEIQIAQRRQRIPYDYMYDRVDNGVIVTETRVVYFFITLISRFFAP